MKLKESTQKDLEIFKSYATSYLIRKRISDDEFIHIMMNNLKKKLLKLEVDDRETKEVFEGFNILQLPYIKTRLDIGDVRLGDEIIIERKEIKDFIASIYDDRLFKQAENMKYFKNKVIIITGNLIELEETNLNIVLGAMASLIIKKGINIVAVDDVSQYCKLVERIVVKYKDGVKKK